MELFDFGANSEASSHAGFEATTTPPHFTAHALSVHLHSQSVDGKLAPAQAALANFMAYLCDRNEPITPSLINRFYYRALMFADWQKNFDQLVVATMAAVRTFSDASNHSFSFADTIDASQLQVVQLTKPKVAQKIATRFFESELSAADQFRLFAERDGRTVAVVRLSGGALRVFVFPALAALMDGEALPLTTDFAMGFTRDLEYEIGLPQHLEIAPYTQARFVFSEASRPAGASAQAIEPTLNGVIVRGLTFQPQAILTNTSLLREAQLFYPVKRLEQFFVDRRSDSIYLELTTNMSRAIDMVLKQHPEAVRFAHAVLERSRLAVEQIFPDDKVLAVQVQSLERALSVESVWPNQKNRLIE